MVLTKEIKRKIEDVVSSALEDEPFEDFLERFDFTPVEVFILLFEAGLIDEEQFEEFLVGD